MPNLSDLVWPGACPICTQSATGLTPKLTSVTIGGLPGSSQRLPQAQRKKTAAGRGRANFQRPLNWTVTGRLAGTPCQDVLLTSIIELVFPPGLPVQTKGHTKTPND